MKGGGELLIFFLFSLYRDFFEKLPTISTSAPELPHWAGVKNVGARVDQTSFLVYRIFLGRYPNQSFRIRSKILSRNRGGYYKSGDPGENDGRKPKHFPKSWPEFVEGITKNVIQELVNVSQRQSTSASGARQSGVQTASRNHPSSRAGDQDDVSYKQTPSNE